MLHKTISVSVPEQTFFKLEKLAKLEERKKSFYVKKALDPYLDKRLASIEAAMADNEYDEFIAAGSETISYNDIRKENNLKD
jgi:predicted transcriptional regulator